MIFSPNWIWRAVVLVPKIFPTSLFSAPPPSSFKKRRRRQVEIGTIGDVKELGPELHVPLLTQLRNGEVLEQRKIHRGTAWPAHDVTAHLAESAECRHHKLGWVEVVIRVLAV